MVEQLRGQMHALQFQIDSVKMENTKLKQQVSDLEEELKEQKHFNQNQNQRHPQMNMNRNNNTNSFGSTMQTPSMNHNRNNSNNTFNSMKMSSPRNSLNHNGFNNKPMISMDVDLDMVNVMCYIYICISHAFTIRR